MYKLLAITLLGAATSLVTLATPAETKAGGYRNFGYRFGYGRGHRGYHGFGYGYRSYPHYGYRSYFHRGYRYRSPWHGWYGRHGYVPRGHYGYGYWH